MLAAGTRSDAGYDSTVRPPSRDSRRGGQEIVFKEQHRALLDPPYPENFQQQHSLDYVNDNRMRSYVQVLTTPTADTPGTTLLLHFDSKRYLIGSLAEGTQRAAIQMGAKLLKVSECFLTGRTEWSNTGGLIGMILTLADSAASSQVSSLEEALTRVRAKGKRLGVLNDAEKMKELEDEAKKDLKNNTLTLFGPPNLNHTLATARRFVFRKGMPVDVHEIRDDLLRKENRNEDEWAPYWADENVKVWAMSISPTTASSPTTNNGIVTPRKRSIEEVNDQQVASNGITANDDLTTEERDQLTVKAVVAEMFNSSWRLDTLHETTLSHVNLPASIFIRNQETNKVERYHGPLPGGEKPLPDPHLRVLVRKPWPGALIECLPPTQPAKAAVSYIIRNHTIRGKFHPDRARELKVEEGRKWAQLASGQSVVSANGETVTPDMVLGESKEGGGLAVVDLPDPSYIDNLTNRPEWREPKVMTGVGALVWICGKDVATDPRIRKFMLSLSHLEHIMSSPDYCANGIALDSAAAATVRLRKVDPVRYVIPVHENASMGRKVRDNFVYTAARGQIIQLEPKLEFQQKHVVPSLSISEIESEMSAEVLEEAEKAHEEIKSAEDQDSDWSKDMPDKEGEIITLGTGSALPSKYRNVSATLLRVPSWGSMLFDCGENTLGQLKRVFTEGELKQVLQELKVIVISHMHADHHLGTVSVIKAWYEEVHGSEPAPTLPDDETSNVQSLFDDQKRLAVISEPAMMHWLSEYTAIEDYGFSRIAPLHISAAFSKREPASKLRWFIPPMQLAGLAPEARREKHTRNVIPPSLLDLQDVQAVAVQHCHGARAVSVTFPSGFKASYSGDCRPSQAFAQIGQGSTVCIHEATFDDELQGDAEAKNHSTTSEALGVAQAMGAKACVLTHFSQRYQKLPVLEHGNGNGDEGQGKALSQDLPVTNAADEQGMEEESANPEDALDGPLGDVAATFPDQKTSDGGSGQQYDIPSKRSHKQSDNPMPDGKFDGPAAVKFKLASDMKVCVAFDYMRVKVGEISQMEKFTPALLKLFAEEDKFDKVVDAAAGGEGKQGKKKKNAGKA